MFKKRKKDKRAPESRTAYLTTIDGAFAGDAEDSEIVEGSLGNQDEDQRYRDVRPQGAHDAAGKAGAPKGSVRFGEGDAAQPRYFSMDPKSGDHMGPVAQRPAQPPVNFDMVDDVEQAIIDAAGSRTPDGAAHEDRAIRARGSLIVAVVLAIVLIIALVIVSLLTINEAAQAETQQTQTGGTAAQVSNQLDVASSSSTTKKTATVPSLTTLIGSDSDQAVDKLGHGAQIAKTADYTNDSNGAVQRITVVLTSDPSTSEYDAPTVYLDLNDEGAVVAASYRVAMSSLGYGAISFKQAVGKSKVIQHALDEAGLTIPSGTTLKLPSNRKSYSTYQSDGKTLTKQKRTFTGTGSAAGMTYHWTGTITYDYAKANASGDLANTKRTVQIGVSV